MARVILGVSGGIAAYKSAELLRRLRSQGHAVRVIPTAGALEFVGRATWEALSGEPVTTTVWDGTVSVDHVALGRSAELVVVAPATADLLARLAGGRADDLLAATLLTARCPVVLAPAMHTEMWDHPATVDNVELLRSRGVIVVDPAVGRLTGADSGAGRLPEPAELAAICAVALARPLSRDLVGRTVVVSAGGTREPLDPVRFLGNRSSGRQGFALAAAARVRGATVHLIACNVELPPPAGVLMHRAGTARELQAVVLEQAAAADVVVMAAAVADFRPAEVSTGKIKKGEGEPTVLPLSRNPDILAGLGAARLGGAVASVGAGPDASVAAVAGPGASDWAGPGAAALAGPGASDWAGPDASVGAGRGPVLVGFAAETPDTGGVDAARTKLAAKGADLLVLNLVGNEATSGTGFETTENAVTLLGVDGARTDLRRTSKDLIAHAIWDAVVPLLE